MDSISSDASVNFYMNIGVWEEKDKDPQQLSFNMNVKNCFEAFLIEDKTLMWGTGKQVT